MKKCDRRMQIDSDGRPYSPHNRRYRSSLLPQAIEERRQDRQRQKNIVKANSVMAIAGCTVLVCGALAPEHTMTSRLVLTLCAVVWGFWCALVVQDYLRWRKP